MTWQITGTHLPLVVGPGRDTDERGALAPEPSSEDILRLLLPTSTVPRECLLPSVGAADVLLLVWLNYTKYHPKRNICT